MQGVRGQRLVPEHLGVDVGVHVHEAGRHDQTRGVDLQVGVPHFPDANAKGEFVFGIDVTPTVWQRAVNACKALQPPGTLSAKRTPKQQTASLRFAQCMRENGVRDFPDPANGEPLINTYRIPSSKTSGGMSILNAAVQRCRSVLAEAATGQ